MLALLGRIAILVAVLLAQHTALAHQISHAVGLPQETGTLCDVHDLLGTVLGVAASAAPQIELLSLTEFFFAAPATGVEEAPLLPSHARDPPLIS